jgi:hypothetical protein
VDGNTVEYVAECFWPGVGDAELRALDQRARASAAELVAEGRPVRYLGSLLMRTDEVVLCFFGGEEDAVRAAAGRAQVPFDRIVEAERSSWSAPGVA